MSQRPAVPGDEKSRSRMSAETHERVSAAKEYLERKYRMMRKEREEKLMR